MPELPEVETIVRQLNIKIKSKVISKIKVIDYNHKIQGDLKNQALSKINQVKRRAKIIIFDLANGYSFLLHLKMTGQLLYYPKPPKEIKKSTHIIFYFKDDSVLLFNDFRKFGYVKLMKTKEVDGHLIKQMVGPEPLEINLKAFQKLLAQRPNSKIKPILMDQSFIAGLGNIYVQEACYQAGILPTRKISSLTKNETKKLHQAIQKILRLAIKHQGTSFDNIYVTPDNQKGEFDKFLKVYHQEVCQKCRSRLIRSVLGSRGTYHCPKCQK